MSVLVRWLLILSIQSWIPGSNTAGPFTYFLDETDPATSCLASEHDGACTVNKATGVLFYRVDSNLAPGSAETVTVGVRNALGEQAIATVTVIHVSPPVVSSGLEFVNVYKTGTSFFWYCLHDRV